MYAVGSLPAGSVDAHMHVFDARIPWAQTAVIFPAEHLLPEYQAVQERLGSARSVLVQPSSYGVDNSLLVRSLRELGPRGRGVAVVHPSVSDNELALLHDAGVRGIRFNLAQFGATTPDMIAPLAKRVAPLGWHVQVHAPADLLREDLTVWEAVECPIVFDHLARVPIEEGIGSPVFRFVADLMAQGRAWVKLSGFYMDSRMGAPTYADSMVIARGFVDANVDRVVWATDWPHVTEQPPPDDATLLTAVLDMLGDDETIRRVLVDNPARLYDFVG